MMGNLTPLVKCGGLRVQEFADNVNVFRYEIYPSRFNFGVIFVQFLVLTDQSGVVMNDAREHTYQLLSRVINFFSHIDHREPL